MNFTVSNEEYNEKQISDKRLFSLTDKIRKVVKLFRNSPVKNDSILQKYVIKEFGKEKKLILDSRTRWNSLVLMFERFHELRICIQKSLFDLKSPYTFSDNDF